MANIIDAVIRLKDQFTPVLNTVQGGMTKYARQAQRLSKDVDKIGKSIENTGNKMAMGLTVPMTAVATSSVMVQKDFSASMSKVATLAGATDTQIQSLTEHAKLMGKTTAWSASQVGEAMQYMALAGWDANEMIDGTAGILNTASSTGEDLVLVTDIITDSLSAFGLTAGESSRMADVLASTATGANTTIGMMGEAFTYVGSVAGAFKYSIEDTALAIGLMANSGIKASQAGTALRKIMTETVGVIQLTGKNLGKYSIETTKADGSMKPFKDTIIELRKAFNQMTDAEKAMNAETIAGKTGMAGLLAIVNASEEEFLKLSSAIDTSKDSAEEMSKKMLNNLAGDFTILSSKLEAIQILIGDKLAPKIRSITQWIGNLADKFLNLDESTQGTILKLAGMVAVMPLMIIAFGKVVRMVASGIKMYGDFGRKVSQTGGIVKTLSSTILSPANKIVFAITAIALVAGLLIKYWQPITAFFKGVWDKIKSYLEGLGLDFEALKQAWNNVVNIISGLCSVLWSVFSSLWNELLKPIIFGIIGGFYIMVNQIVGLLGGWLSGITDVINGIVNIFNGLVDFIAGVFTGNWGRAWEGVKNIFAGIFDGIKGIAKGAINGIIGFINGGIRGINKVGSFIGVKGKDGNGIVPEIPMLYTGTNNWQGGTAMIHDKGAEIVDLPQGTRVYPHDKSMKMAYEDGKKSSTGFNLEKLADTIIVREDADVDRIANALYNKFQKQSLNMA